MNIVKRLTARIRNSVYERCRYFYVRERVRRLCNQFSIPQGDYPLDLLEMLLSVKSTVTSVPKTLIDVGAHKGQFAALAQNLFSFNTVVCVEPNVDLLSEIRKNVHAPKVHIVESALSNYEGSSPLFIHEDLSMSSLVPVDPDVLKNKFPGDDPQRIRQKEVSVRTLDWLFRELSLPRESCFLKLDTQGNELHILQGGQEALKMCSVLLIEYMFCTPYITGFRFEDLITFLFTRGFRCKAVVNIHKRPSFEISGVDFVFEREG